MWTDAVCKRMALKLSGIHFSETNNDIILDVKAHLGYVWLHLRLRTVPWMCVWDIKLKLLAIKRCH